MYNKYLLFITFLLFSCAEREEIKTIGEREYRFDEKLSSISFDENGSFWIGSENGDIFYFKDNTKMSFDLGEDRIYKIKKEIKDTGDTLFWIGVRNSGLQKWRKKTTNKLEKLKTYTINFKQDKYSPYDFVCSGNIIYTATSQGIYSLDKESESDSLSLIYPSKEFLSKQNGNSFIVHNICLYNDSLLLASTQSGIWIYGIRNHKTGVILNGFNIEHVSVYNDTLFSVSGNHLYLNTIEGELINKIEAGNGAKVYYQMQGIHYLVGPEELLLSNNLKDFLSIRLRRNVPMKCRNIILPDTFNHFTYLLAENAVWKIPTNIDVFKGNKPIKASCSNADNIYYLTRQNELYVQNKNSNKAKWIYTFSSENLIQWMDISGHELYFCNTDNEFRKMEISDNWVKNMLLHSPESIIQPKEKIISAKIKNKDKKPLIYLGMQDGMIVVDNNRIDTIPRLVNAYITSMFENAHTDRLYIATLNDGVFYLNQSNDIKQVPKTGKTFFIQDIIATNDHNSNLIMLTNHQIISQNPTDSIKVKGYKKLLYANDTLFYALPEFGIHKFIISKNRIIDKGVFFKDIRFNRKSSFSYEDKIVLGSTIGSVILSINKEESPVWVEFENAVNINLMLFALVTLIIVIAACITIVVVVKKQNAHIVQIRKRKEDLRKRVDDLMTFYNILDETKNTDVSELNDLIDAIDVNAGYKNKVNSKLEEYSLRIGKLNRQVALLIPKKLENQIEQIAQTESVEKTLLLKQSNDVQNQNDIELIKDQVRINELWLQQRTTLFNALELNINNLSGCIEIEGVNNHLYERLISIIHDDKYKPLADLMSSYEPLEKEIIEISSPASKEKIDSYINNTTGYLEEKVCHDQGLVFVQESLNEIKHSYSNDNIALLRGLKVIEPQLILLKNLDEIKKLTVEYKEKHDRIVRENNEQISKKFDRELASFISDKTEPLTRSIGTHISYLYNQLSEADKHIVADTLKLANTEGQHAKVLVLLIADTKIKRSLIPGMLGIYGNLNPVVSRLINDRIRVNESILKTELDSTKNRSVFIYLILKLLD